MRIGKVLGIFIGILMFFNSKGQEMALSDSTLFSKLQKDTTQFDTTTIDKPPVSDIVTTINYNAKDSIFLDLKTQTAKLYGESHIDYGQTKLDAATIEINWVDKIISANHIKDSTGRKVGKPLFTEGNSAYETDDMQYHFLTKKAIINGVITEQDGAIMHGERVKKNEFDELFIQNAGYTTCTLEDPHFHIESKKLKVIPKNKIVSGPFNLKFREVPTPLWFPFGMFPQPRQISSGLLFPKWGEETTRGFFLRDGGYYFAPNDYIDMKLTGDIYSKGSHAMHLASSYKKRYYFNGTLSVDYNRNKTGTLDAPAIQKDLWVRWNHSPVPRGNSRISANVSAGTSTYSQNTNLVAQNYNQSTTSQFQSNVSYSKTFTGTPFNLNASLRHSQNIKTKVASVSAPDLSWNMNRQYPFKNWLKSDREVLKNFNFSHAFTLKNEMTNQVNISENADEEVDTVLSFNAANLGIIFDEARNGAKHTIPFSTSFTAFKYFTFSPSVTYSEVWYLKSYQYEYESDSDQVITKEIQGFERAGWLSGTSISTNLRLYGTYFFKKGNVSAIRHIMNPSVSLSYTPNYEKSQAENFDTYTVNGVSKKYSHFQGLLYGGPPTDPAKASINFSLNNNVEMKVKTKNDSVESFKKVSLIDNLSISGFSYNFMADSFKLGNSITTSLRTSLFQKKVNINLGSGFDPYVYEDDGSKNGKKIDVYAWNRGPSIGNLKSITANISFSLRPKGADKKKESKFGSDEELEFINQNPDLYLDFNIPWSVNVQYNISKTRTGIGDFNRNETLTLSGDLSITSNTKITFRGGYDFDANRITNPVINIARDLHCWSLSFNWVPFGAQQNFQVTLQPKSALLQDLKLERRRSFFDSVLGN